MFRFAIALGVLASLVGPGEAAVQNKTIKYNVGDQQFIGYLAWDDQAAGKRPGVLVVHEWWGLNDYARSCANKLAELGYVAFAGDMYGDGKTAKHPNEAAALAGQVRQHADEWQRRAVAALNILKQQPQCDPQHVAAIGYCFGGSTALVLAYSGADLDAVVTFHGALPVPTEEQAKAIKASIVICHGALDSFIPEETIHKVRDAFEAAHVDYELNYYAGARHSFTVEGSDKHGIPGIAYNKKADERSWERMKRLFEEKFK